MLSRSEMFLWYAFQLLAFLAFIVPYSDSAESIHFPINRFCKEEYSVSNMAKLLSPPWYTLLNKFKYTFGRDSTVTVGNLENPDEPVMNIPIIVDDERKGMALRTLIRAGFPMGNIHVNTTLKNSKGIVWEGIFIEDYKQLQDVITDALTGNPLFVEAKPRVLPGPNKSLNQMGLIMTKSIVQFFNDDLDDFYSNFNGVTAQVTSELIQQSFGAKNTLYILMGTSTK